MYNVFITRNMKDTINVQFLLIRAIWRLILLWKHHGGIQPIPPIAPLDRDKYTKQFKHNPTEVKPYTDGYC